MKERIPFGISYRSEIEGGKYLVETRDGSPARIVCWDAKATRPILYLVSVRGTEWTYSYPSVGHYYSLNGEGSVNDLFLVPNPDYKEPIAEPPVSSEPSETAVWAAMAAFEAKFTRHEEGYQCKIQFLKLEQVHHREYLMIFGCGKTPYKAAMEVYKQLKEDQLW